MEKEIINKIKELKEEGKTAKEISKELNMPYSSVRYHFSEKEKTKSIERAKKYNRENPEKINKERNKLYQRKYKNDYYHSPENHERLKEYHREYQRKRYNALKSN